MDPRLAPVVDVACPDREFVDEPESEFAAWVETVMERLLAAIRD
ncbi:hypothetical protein [Haloarchaeobius sp. HME9146]|nr:hypothetical protein [Haloarchaeobius sp. HME9146]MCT9098252.1 hypothetical protein [Haloarchaeobius sp. HME9146]